jgi:hypothetical protein
MEPQEIKSKPRIQDTRSKGRIRRWLAANRLPLLSFALVTTLSVAVSITFFSKESKQLSAYKNGLITIKDLSIQDKFTAWRDRLAEGKCGENFNEVMAQAQEEYMHQLRLGNDDYASKLLKEIEFYTQDQIEVKKNPKCKKD